MLSQKDWFGGVKVQNCDKLLFSTIAASISIEIRFYYSAILLQLVLLCPVLVPHRLFSIFSEGLTIVFHRVYMPGRTSKNDFQIKKIRNQSEKGEECRDLNLDE